MAIQYLQSFVVGFLISLMGSIPLGNLNLSAMQIAALNAYKAFRFSMGVVIVEMAYLAITLVLLGSFTIGNTGLILFRIISGVFLLVLAIASFRAAKKEQQNNKLINNNKNPLVLGLIMSAVNPMQFPFWVGWVVYSLSHSLLVKSVFGFSVFVIGAGTGTFIALLLFIFAGLKLSAIMYRNQKLVNTLFGIIFLLLAISQFVKLF